MKTPVPPNTAGSKHTSRLNDYCLRPACESDLQGYLNGFFPMDPELIRLTGSRDDFTPREVAAFFRKCLTDPTRQDFLLIAPDGSVAGECVLNEIDNEARSANFRIAIFREEHRGKGLGQWMTRFVRDHAFETMKLHRLSLNVFSVNARAEHVYRKAGFRREGVLRDALRIDNAYADDILMAILEEEWRGIKEEET